MNPRRRWWQLLIGIVCMSMIANLQYGWTLFVNPIADHFHWSKAAIQVAFTIFVLTETWLVPAEGWLVDRYGPRPVMVAGGALVGVAWALNSVADSLALYYVAAAIGGVGAGAVYGTCVGNALKWFPDRRGLAAGLTAMGFGAGSALTVVPIAAMIQRSGFAATFLYFGVAQGLLVIGLGLFMTRPPARPEPPGRRTDDMVFAAAAAVETAGITAVAATVGPSVDAAPSISARTSAASASNAIDPRSGTAIKLAAAYNPVRLDYTPLQMLRTPVFWILYAMFVMMAAGGLMATAQLAPIAHDFMVADVPVSILGLTLPALTFALSIDRALNGLTRPFFGWISDHIGRELTMFIAFSIEGCGILLLNRLGSDPLLFVILSGVVFFAWGEIYSLFPATCGDCFGSRHAAANSGLLYTAKGTAALLVPLTSILAAAGGWHTVFWVASLLNLVAALMALLVLQPMRRRLRVSAVMR